MKVKILIFSLIISLLAVFPAIASSTDYVIDNADLLTDEEESKLEAIIAEAVAENRLGIYILTVDEYEGNDIDRYSVSYYENNSLGYGASDTGAFLVLSMAERDYGYYTFGDKAEACKRISDSFLNYISSGDYYRGFAGFVDAVTDSVVRYEGGTVDFDEKDDGYNYDYEYEYDYDYDYDYNYGHSGKDFVSSDNLGICILIGVVAGLIAALITVGVMKGKLKTVRTSSYAGSYIRQNSFNLTNSQDIYLYSNVVAVPRNTESSNSFRGGGSSFHGGGGSIHSGSHGKF